MLEHQFSEEVSQSSRQWISGAYDLASTETDNDVGNGNVLCLTRSVGHHNTPAGTKGVLGSLNSFRNSTNLVDLQQEGIAGLGLDGLLDESRVGDGQIITNTVSQ